jgi:hypothetical protein
MARALTFPKVGGLRWINAETGVTIRPVSAVGGVAYGVFAPDQSAEGWSRAAVKRTLNEARAAAKDIAVAMRAQISRAHREALLAFAIVMADRAEAAITAATHEEALSGTEADRLFGYLTTAKLFRETDPERSIGWSNEILTQTDAAADRETEAAKAEQSPRSQAPQLDGGRPAYWGTAWLEVQHPAHIDMITQSTALDSVAYLRLATEPQRGRFFPGPM